MSILFHNKPWLFKKQIRDDKFGRMWFINCHDPLNDHYQCHFTFKPTNSEIGAYFTSDKEGIDPKLQHFFGEIERKYFELLLLFINPVEEYMKKKYQQEIKIQDFKKEFVLFAISLSRYSYQKQEWILGYYPNDEPLKGFNIKFKNWDVVDVVN